MENQVVIRSKPNSSHIRKLNPQLHVQTKEGDSNDENTYTHSGAFKGEVFLGTFKPQTPTFNLTTNKWGFKGDISKMRELVDKIGLRYERGPKAGQVIKSEDVDIHNRSDAFFDHSEMVVRLENGQAKLNKNLPKDLFLYLCLSDDPEITNSKVGNPYLAAGQKFELLDIQEEKAKEGDGMDDRIDAYSLFKPMKNNFDRSIAVGRALGIIKEDKPEDPTALLLELEKRFVTNVSLYPNSNKTYQRVFIETAEKDTETLNRMHLIHFGVFKSILRPKIYEDWSMKMRDGSLKSLIGVKGYLDAFEYFANDKNYADLENLMHSTNAFNTNG